MEVSWRLSELAQIDGLIVLQIIMASGVRLLPEWSRMAKSNLASPIWDAI